MGDYTRVFVLVPAESREANWILLEQELPAFVGAGLWTLVSAGGADSLSCPLSSPNYHS